MVRKKKTAAQLNREIFQSLAHTLSKRSHLSKPDAEIVGDEAIFEIASDAFKEGDVKRGEQLLDQMREPRVARCVEKTRFVIPESHFSRRENVKRSLYRLYTPILDHFGTKHWWVIASTSRGETHLYPAEDGRVIDYDEIAVGRSDDHDALLKHQGYRVVVCGKEAAQAYDIRESRAYVSRSTAITAADHSSLVRLISAAATARLVDAYP